MEKVQWNSIDKRQIGPLEQSENEKSPSLPVNNIVIMRFFFKQDYTIQ